MVERDVEKDVSTPQFVDTLRRLADSLEAGESFRIQVEGVVVRYAVEMHCLQMRVEGNLPEAMVDALTADLVSKWSAIENDPFVVRVS